MKSDDTLRIFIGATAIVTGAASGIGRGLVEELAKRGCEVILADLQLELLQEIASKINDSGGKATAVQLDVTDFSALEKLVQQTVERTGRLDYMFNNVGIALRGNVINHSIDDWKYIVDVNLQGVINGVHAAYSIMRNQGFGHIVNTSSIGGLMPTPGMVSYATTKYGIMGLSISLRGEAAVHGIRVSVLCPGVVRTGMLDGGGKYGRTLIEMGPEREKLLADVYEKRFRPISPQLFARKALNAVAKNKSIIVIPARYKFIWWTNRIAPSLGIFLGKKAFQLIQKRLGITA